MIKDSKYTTGLEFVNDGRRDAQALAELKVTPHKLMKAQGRVHRIRGRILLLFLPILLLLLSACSAPSTTIATNSTTFRVSSSAFAEGAEIPAQYTYQLSGQCAGQNLSPELEWMGAPAGTQSLAIVAIDPDAQNFVHWVQYNLPPSTSQVAEAVGGPAVGVKGKNGFGASGYGGPCPPNGSHRYVFTVYALDAVLALSAGATNSQLQAAMQGHILGQAQLMGKRSK